MALPKGSPEPTGPGASRQPGRSAVDPGRDAAVSRAPRVVSSSSASSDWLKQLESALDTQQYPLVGEQLRRIAGRGEKWAITQAGELLVEYLALLPEARGLSATLLRLYFACEPHFDAGHIFHQQFLVRLQEHLETWVIGQATLDACAAVERALDLAHGKLEGLSTYGQVRTTLADLRARSRQHVQQEKEAELQTLLVVGDYAAALEVCRELVSQHRSPFALSQLPRLESLHERSSSSGMPAAERKRGREWEWPDTPGGTPARSRAELDAAAARAAEPVWNRTFDAPPLQEASPPTPSLQKPSPPGAFVAFLPQREAAARQFLEEGDGSAVPVAAPGLKLEIQERVQQMRPLESDSEPVDGLVQLAEPQESLPDLRHQPELPSLDQLDSVESEPTPALELIPDEPPPEKKPSRVGWMVAAAILLGLGGLWALRPAPPTPLPAPQPPVQAEPQPIAPQPTLAPVKPSVPQGPPSFLSLAVTPPDRLELYVNGNLQVNGVVERLEVPAGKQLIEIYRESHEPFRQEVETLAAQELKLDIELVRSPTLNLDVFPEDGIEIRLNGKRVYDSSPLREYVLSPGSYKLEVLRGGQVQYETDFTAVEGKSVDLRAQLKGH